MTGPQHYRKAAELIEYAEQTTPERAKGALMEAQIHATLAMTAAVIDTQTPPPDAYRLRQWELEMDEQGESK